MVKLCVVQADITLLVVGASPTLLIDARRNSAADEDFFSGETAYFLRGQHADMPWNYRFSKPFVDLPCVERLTRSTKCCADLVKVRYPSHELQIAKVNAAA